MNLQESIRRIIREEDYSPAGKEITPNSIIVHKSNPMFRDKIMEHGLKVSAGECYKVYVGYGVKCKPAIFATNSTNKRAWFDSTYDDDIWEINTEMIPDVKWYKDRHFESTKKHIVTFQDIPKEAITLKYEGTGSGDVKKWNKDSPNLYESIRKILKEETEKKPIVFNYKKYTLILSNNPCDIFTHFKVENLHGLNYKKCLAHKNTKDNAYIAGLTNISPKTKKHFLFLNLNRLGKDKEKMGLIMHETMHLSLELYKHDVENKEEEIITFAENEAYKIYDIIQNL